MKNLQLLPLILLVVLGMMGCGQKYYASGNPFIRKNPIRNCKGKVPVDKRREKVEFGVSIDEARNISLLTPIIVFKARQRTDLDSAYLARTIADLTDTVENMFVRDEWVDRVIDKSYELDGADGDSIKSMMLRYKNDTVDYSNWEVTDSFSSEDRGNYSLLMVLDGIIGFDGAPVRERYFWKPDEIGAFRLSELTGNHLMFFVIDNATRQVTFADHYVFHCDIRNKDSLKKVLEYAFLKLLDVRFPKT